MSEFVMCGDVLVRPSSSRIAKDNVSDFRESAALLAEAKAIADQARTDAAAVRAEGHAAGREEALAEMCDALAKCTVQLHEDMAREDARRERAAAIAAMEAVEHLIGSREDASVVTGLVEQTLSRSGAKASRIVVAEQWVDAVRSQLPESSARLVEGDPELQDMGCRIEAGGGRIIADLEMQMAALRTRWDVGAADLNG